uniref:Uncharacterized protein n=1 Tax=Romanomermis culicivorax TaxID=13658 RepID=A0A915JJR5_ROMCU
MIGHDWHPLWNVLFEFFAEYVSKLDKLDFLVISGSKLRLSILTIAVNYAYNCGFPVRHFCGTAQQYAIVRAATDPQLQAAKFAAAKKLAKYAYGFK